MLKTLLFRIRQLANVYSAMAIIIWALAFAQQFIAHKHKMDFDVLQDRIALGVAKEVCQPYITCDDNLFQSIQRALAHNIANDESMTVRQKDSFDNSDIYKTAVSYDYQIRAVSLLNEFATQPQFKDKVQMHNLKEKIEYRIEHIVGHTIDEAMTPLWERILMAFSFATMITFVIASIGVGLLFGGNALQKQEEVQA